MHGKCSLNRCVCVWMGTEMMSIVWISFPLAQWSLYLYALDQARNRAHLWPGAWSPCLPVWVSSSMHNDTDTDCICRAPFNSTMTSQRPLWAQSNWITMAKCWWQEIALDSCAYLVRDHTDKLRIVVLICSTDRHPKHEINYRVEGSTILYCSIQLWWKLDLFSGWQWTGKIESCVHCHVCDTQSTRRSYLNGQYTNQEPVSLAAHWKDSLLQLLIQANQNHALPL